MVSDIPEKYRGDRRVSIYSDGNVIGNEHYDVGLPGEQVHIDGLSDVGAWRIAQYAKGLPDEFHTREKLIEILLDRVNN